jgi:ribosomal protein S18 acetylase RimI-like enzyme
MDVYVLASYREGFPRSAMEAAAMGLPVVATDIRGCREVVDDGETGLLVAPRDAAALADAIATLARDAGRRRSMGEAAVKKAQRDFDQRRVIDTTLDVYDELLGRRRGASDGIRLATTDDVARIAQLHATRIGTGFLSSLGERFLRRLYRRAVLSPDAFVLVTGDPPVDGFAAVALSTGRLYRSFVVRDGIVAGVEAAPGLLRTPRRTWETLRYPASAVDLPPAEVLSIAVDERASGRGLGGALAGAVEEELQRRGVDAARIVIAADNSASLGVFTRRGWTLAERVELHSGTPSEILVWQRS